MGVGLKAVRSMTVFVEVNIHQAKTHLSRLLERVALGEEAIIVKSGRPIAELVAVGKATANRKLGSAEWDFVVPSDFNAPLPGKIEESFWK